jgi:dihydrofolate reductase
VIRLIAALDSERGIATDKGIPWKLPGDRAFFRRETERGVIVMGRSTYTEFNAPLHGRVNYVLTSRSGPLREGFHPVASLEELTHDRTTEDIWVIGGAAVYASTIADADELVLTQVNGDFGCTKFFPAYRDDFVRTTHGPDQHEGDIGYRFERWKPRESVAVAAGR